MRLMNMSEIEPVDMEVLEDQNEEQYSHCGLDGKCKQI